MKRHRVLPVLFGLSWLALVSCGEQTTEPSIPPETGADLAVASNTWLTRRDMPLDLVLQTAAVVPNAAGQSILYAIGGAKAGSPKPSAPIPVGEVRAYNVATNTWTTKQDIPVARWGMNGAGVIDGKVYVSGGYTKEGYRQPTASLFVYDIASNTWAQKRSMPAAGAGGVTGVIRGQLYVVTFSSPYTGAVVNFFRYNPTTDSWTKLPSPTGYSNLDVGGGVINNKLYLVGPSVLEYDPVTNRWTKKAAWSSQYCYPLPNCGLEGRGVVMLARLYVFGAELNGGGVPSPGIFIYDPVSDTWESKPLLTKFSWSANYELTAARVFVNGQPRVEVIGGYRPGNNQQYIP